MYMLLVYNAIKNKSEANGFARLTTSSMTIYSTCCSAVLNLIYS